MPSAAAVTGTLPSTVDCPSFGVQMVVTSARSDFGATVTWALAVSPAGSVGSGALSDAAPDAGSPEGDGGSAASGGAVRGCRVRLNSPAANRTAPGAVTVSGGTSPPRVSTRSPSAGASGAVSPGHDASAADSPCVMCAVRVAVAPTAAAPAGSSAAAASFGTVTVAVSGPGWTGVPTAPVDG